MTAPEAELARVLVAIWIAFWAGRSILKLAHGAINTIHFVQLVFATFFGVPLALDVVVGVPEYTYQIGFLRSQADPLTEWVYLAYLTFVPVVFWLFGGERSGIARNDFAHVRLGPWARVVAWSLLLAVPLVVLASPSPSYYLSYAATIRTGRVDPFHGYVSLAALLALLASVTLLAIPGASPTERAMVLPFLAGSLWVHGKRSAVALTAYLLLYLLTARGTITGRRFLLATGAAICALALFSVEYQASVRGVASNPAAAAEPTANADWYVSYRVDFGRDGVTRQAIYAEVNPSARPILDFRGQSLLFDAFFWVPRTVWRDKPYPYAVYATAAMLGRPASDLGWGVTTSWLDESIANLGWLGFLFGPLVPALVCAIGDRRRTAATSVLTLLVGSLLLVLHLPAFIVPFLLWLVLIAMGPRRWALGQTLGRIRLKWDPRVRGIPNTRPSRRVSTRRV